MADAALCLDCFTAALATIEGNIASATRTFGWAVVAQAALRCSRPATAY